MSCFKGSSEEKGRSGSGMNSAELLNPSGPYPELACAVPCCLVLRGAGHVPWLLMAAEEPAGSSYVVLAITPPAWPCFYPRVQQGVLVRNSFLSDSASDEFLLRKSCNTSNDQSGVPLSRTGPAGCAALRAGWKPVWCCTACRSQHLKGPKIICVILSLWCEL